MFKTRRVFTDMGVPSVLPGLILQGLTHPGCRDAECSR